MIQFLLQKNYYIGQQISKALFNIRVNIKRFAHCCNAVYMSVSDRALLAFILVSNTYNLLVSTT